MNIKKSAAAIGTLIDVNKDRLKGYLKLAGRTSDQLMKKMFQRYAEHSQDAIKTLGALLAQMGLPLTTGRIEDSSESLPLTRINLQQQTNEIGKRPLLAICLTSENVVLERYNQILSDAVDHLTIEQHKMIYKQYMFLKKDHQDLLTLQF
ncbi:MAG: DUF2383 domain-containing protein [Chitinophagaceae bacterium]